MGSRRSCETLVRTGKVTINDKPVTTLAQTVDPDNDTVVVDGRPVRLSEAPVFIMFHKPRGIVVSRKGQGSKTVFDMVKGFAREEVDTIVRNIEEYFTVKELSQRLETRGEALKPPVRIDQAKEIIKKIDPNAKVDDNKLTNPSRASMRSDMESLIHHFKFFYRSHTKYFSCFFL